MMVAPVEPGTYEVRYYSRDKGGLLATAPFTVTHAVVEIDAPRLIQRASDLRVLVGNVEIGAAWHRTSKENTEYHSVKLDDPSFPAPIYANLFKGETDYTLVWSR